MSSEISELFQTQVITLLQEIRDILAERLTDSAPTEWTDKDVVDLACTLVWRNADNLSHRLIAEQLTNITGRKIHHTGLLRNRMFQAYRDLYERLTSGSDGYIPRGHMTEEGDIDAYN